MNVKNLNILANYLSNLPDDYEQFAMSQFYSDLGTADVLDFIKNNGGIKCGAVACALGHGPVAGIKCNIENNGTDWAPDYWERYCKLAFGIDFNDDVGQWMFGGDWGDIDNTPKGAAARIRYYLNIGEIGLDNMGELYQISHYQDQVEDLVNTYEEFRT